MNQLPRIPFLGLRLKARHLLVLQFVDKNRSSPNLFGFGRRCCLMGGRLLIFHEGSKYVEPCRLEELKSVILKASAIVCFKINVLFLIYLCD